MWRWPRSGRVAARQSSPADPGSTHDRPDPSSSSRKPQSEGSMLRKRSALTNWLLALLLVIVYALVFWFSQGWY